MLNMLRCNLRNQACGKQPYSRAIFRAGIFAGTLKTDYRRMWVKIDKKNDIFAAIKITFEQ